MSGIPEGWVETTLGAIADIIDSLHKTPTYSVHGYPMVRVTDIKRGYLDTEKCLVVDEIVFRDFSKKHKPKINDIIFSRVGSAGVAVICKSDDPFCLGQNTVFISPHHSSPYLYYWLDSFSAKEEISAHTTGTTQKTISLKSIREMNLVIPTSLEEIDAIADILSSFDEKIELLREQNKVLEDMAQALFKEWFVDFNFPGATGKMISSELGEIPEGWRVGNLTDIADFLNGLALQKFPAESEIDYLPVIKIKELKNGITSQTAKASSKLDSKYVIKNGDLLFSWSGSLEVSIWNNGDGALNQHLFKVTSSEFPKWFYMYWIKRHLVSFKSIAASKATTMGHINRNHLEEALVLIPSSDIINLGTKSIGGLLEKFEHNHTRVSELSKIRDVLLPKLMNGSIRVKDFEVSK